MKASKVARALLRALASLALLAAFAVWDWVPTVKDLGRLRRQQGDLALKIKNYADMTAGFTFPDAGEEMLFRRGARQLRRSLLSVEDDDAWAAVVLAEIQSAVAAERIANARVLFTPQVQGTDIGASGPARPDLLADWLFHRQLAAVREGFAAGYGPGRHSWNGIIRGVPSRRRERPASRVLGVALAASLPSMQNFVNRISWGEARLEIVRLHLEPGAGISRAWLVCRSCFRVRAPSPLAVKMEPGEGGQGALIDPDSPLLWQKADPGLAPAVEKRELPMAGSPW